MYRHVICPVNVQRVMFMYVSIAATEPDPRTNSQRASLVLLIQSINVSLNRMQWCHGGMFVWAGGGVLVGGGCKVALYVDTWTQKVVIQAHQLHSSQRMCQQLREVSAT